MVIHDSASLPSLPLFGLVGSMTLPTDRGAGRGSKFGAVATDIDPVHPSSASGRAAARDWTSGYSISPYVADAISPSHARQPPSPRTCKLIVPITSPSIHDGDRGGTAACGSIMPSNFHRQIRE